MRNTWVVLLRGINVGGHRKVPMAELKQAYREAGCDPVLTYIQSWNVVVGSDEDDAGSLSLTLRAALEERCGVDAALMVRSADEWRALVDAHPWAGVDPATLHLGLLDAAPTTEATRQVAALQHPPAEVMVIDREVYWRLPQGVTAARGLLEAAGRLLGPSTMRNWRTVERVCALVDQAEAR